MIGRHWDLAGGIQVESVDAGLNNPTFRVSAGRWRYAVRLYRNLDPSSIRREHVLLGVLAAAGLSFRVPIPVRCRDGTTLAQTPHGCLALFDWIDGQHPDPKDQRHLPGMGAALAELDETLLRLDATLAGLPGEPAPGHGQFDRIHPAVADPTKLAARLAAEASLQDVTAEIAWFGTAISACLGTVSGLYATLPQQWIHQDLALSNVLQVGGRVTGVLDFEFSDRDLRALDLVAMLTNCVAGFGDQMGWQQAEALCRGYCSRAHPTEAEVEAIPDLMRLRYAVANIHGPGRWLAGLNPTEEVIRRLRYGAACDHRVQQEADTGCGA